MLVLSRYLGETIIIDDDVHITVLAIKGSQVRLGINAPKETRVHRLEIHQRIQLGKLQDTEIESESTSRT